MTRPSPADGPARFQGRAAGLVSRTVAAIADILVVLGLAVLADLFAGAVRFLVLGPPFAPPKLSDWLTGVLGFALTVGYLAVSWTVTGQTVGARLMGLRVVRRPGRPLGVGRALLRAVLCVVFPLGLFWTPLSRRDASVADLVVRSAVVYDWFGGRARDGQRPLP
ncbi:RDD family protein [Streptomyces sp. WAC 06783]|uniref:RDD family protein n=1 Tax=Streptomyces sp. WAC 06783 TaxID=2203211 RepID=UPI000F736CD8|nr:RDD family protein [Streptomyces sp. WAC 06783]RSO09038.1 RDD family protein [Streptomyces sp. WAC 06783]